MQPAEDKARRTRDPVSRAFDLLRAMVDSGQDVYGVRELAQTVGIPPSSAHRLLNLLEGAGIVSRLGGGSYALGFEFHRLALRGSELMPVSRAAGDVLEDLRVESGETSVLGIYDHNRREMMFTLSHESPNPLRYVLQHNTWVPVYAGATGLAIMAFLDAEEQDAIIADSALSPLTDRTIQSVDELREELAAIRERGYASTHGQRVTGAVGFAAPIFDVEGQVLGDIIITLPEVRYSPDRQEHLGRLVMEGAARVTRRLGGPAA